MVSDLEAHLECEGERMKDYQPKQGQYVIPHNTYMEILYIIRSYDQMKEECNDILTSSPERDGGSSGSSISNGPLSYVIKTEERSRRIDAVDHALQKIPPEYRRGVMENIIDRKPFPDDAARSTYSVWKQRMIYFTAEKLHLI